MNHLQHGHFMPNMERYSVDEFADDIGLEDLEAQKAVKELEQQTGRLCKYSARVDLRFKNMRKRHTPLARNIRTAGLLLVRSSSFGQISTSTDSLCILALLCNSHNE